MLLSLTRKKVAPRVDASRLPGLLFTPLLGVVDLLKPDVPQVLVAGQKAVAVQVHCRERRHLLPALAPLEQRDLPVLVEVQCREPVGEPVAALRVRRARLAVRPAPLLARLRE